jgi:hypothetical protein
MPIQNKFKKSVVPVLPQPISSGPRLISNRDDSVRQDVMTKEEVAQFLRVEPSTVYATHTEAQQATVAVSSCREVSAFQPNRG